MSQNDPCGCNSVLVTTIMKKNHGIEKYLAQLDLVTESNFEQFKRHNSGGGGGSVGIPGIFDIGINASTTYEEFKEKRKTLFTLHNYNSRSKENFNERIKYLPDYVVQAWVECKYNCDPAPGIHGKIEKVSPELIVVEFVWIAKLGDEGNHKIENQLLVGGKCLNKGVQEGYIFKEEEIFDVKNNKFAAIERERGKEVIITLEVDGSSDYLYIPKYDFKKLFFDGIEVGGSFQDVITALENGVSVNAKRANGEPALTYALHQKNDEVYNHLINHKDINLNNRGYLGETTLYVAADAKDLDKVKQLLEKGANPNIAINNKTYQKGIYVGWTPLSLISYFDKTNPDDITKAIIKELKKYGAIDGRHTKNGVII